MASHRCESVQELSGDWRLCWDRRNRGREQRWASRVPRGARRAPVPGVIQQVFAKGEGVFWYYHTFTAAEAPGPGRRALLAFGAVDYLAEAWLNGVPVGGHEGGETPFELDVTGALRPGEENLLAVRVLNPCARPIDGYCLGQVPHRNKSDHKDYRPGAGYNTGGILLPVCLRIVPDVRVADVHVRPDAATGRIPLTVTVRNDTSSAATGSLAARVGPAAEGALLDAAEARASFPPGDSRHELTLRVPRPRLWDIDDPFLYRVGVELAAGAFRHDRLVRCGFRDFRVTDGFFHLNGRRIFLRSTHTGNHFPIGQVVPPNADLMRRDFILAKATGYNMVRFIAGMPWPEQLDFCDEIGLMVYEENLASWALGDSPQMPERFDRSFREMVLRDRNHPSVTIWGMLNETPDGPVFRRAVEDLQLVRDLDPTRLVLLGSGRWDDRPDIGSVSNPGSRQWQCVWGDESPAAARTGAGLGREPGGYMAQAGDAHVYPLTPQSEADTERIRTLGAGTKPVFLSEYGIGSQFNVIDELRRYEQAGAREDLPDMALIRNQAERLAADLKRLGLDDVFAFPEDLLRESYRHSVRQRRICFDTVRSNPQLCGYNVTGMLDHGLTGEGMWTFWREWKPGIADALRDGWAPLRWCLFARPRHAYAGRPLTLEAVLANEDVLAPGEYPACLRLFSREHGTVWERRVTVRIPKPPRGRALGPLAVPVLKTTLRRKLPAGAYTFAACLERGGAAVGDRLDLRLADPAALPRGAGTLALLGVGRKVERWLTDRGFRCRAFDASGRRGGREVILVGEPRPSADAEALWSAVHRRARSGASVLFLSPAPFRTAWAPDWAAAKGWSPPTVLPLGEQVRSREFHDWLYHKDVVARRHPVFDGLAAGGLLDWDYYGPVVGHGLYDCAKTPDEVVAAAFAAGYCCQGGYDCGVVIGAYRHGRGRIVLNALDVLGRLGHPAADRLLLNLVRWAQAPWRG